MHITLFALPHHETALSADVQKYWPIPLSPAERIPAEAQVLEVAVTQGFEHGEETVIPPIAVSEALKVEAIRAMIDGMGLNPYINRCKGCDRPGTAFLEHGTATFTFRATPGGAILAVASATDAEPGAATLTLPLRGRTVKLDSGAFIGEAQKLLGVQLYVPREAATGIRQAESAAATHRRAPSGPLKPRLMLALHGPRAAPLRETQHCRPIEDGHRGGAPPACRTPGGRDGPAWHDR
jgi:hypothetical protein